ncbi:MAG: polysaccharide pyruvyl transferase WcaK-like protein [Verrucomicrobiales bacterium]|jgi:polysaccharide pyruvyl transferase WcaK-like protein
MPAALAFINPRLSTRNVGDHFIEDSVKRILTYDPEHSIDVDPRKPISAESIDAINQRQAAVIVGTNLWYRDVLHEGRWMFSMDDLRKIKVPIIPLGVGTTRHRGEDNAFTAESLEILRWLHDHCEQASARDPRTLEALEEAGFTNARMTGCPTLYRSLMSEWNLVAPKDSKRLVLTVRKGHRKNIRRLCKMLEASGWEILVAAQQEKDNYFRKSIPLIQKAKPTLYDYDIKPYQREVADAFGVIGWRLHGNMLHLAHGNPAAYFANCSRAASFCEAFRLPCVVAEDGDIIPDSELEAAVGRLTDPESFEPFRERYGHYVKEMAGFLTANGLGHHLCPEVAV